MVSNCSWAAQSHYPYSSIFPAADSTASILQANTRRTNTVRPGLSRDTEDPFGIAIRDLLTLRLRNWSRFNEGDGRRRLWERVVDGPHNPLQSDLFYHVPKREGILEATRRHGEVPLHVFPA